jgi:transposase
LLDERTFPHRHAAGCVAHSRRKFEELTKPAAGASPVAVEAVQRLARIYHVEGHFAVMTPEEHLYGRQRLSRPLWDELHLWLRVERSRLADGGRIALAINYSLNYWQALTRHLEDGAVPIDNNLSERQIKPWKLGANWMFIGSELAGQRAAVVMSLVPSAKLNELDSWAYLRDVLARIHSHPSHRIDELLPHLWRPR